MVKILMIEDDEELATLLQSRLMKSQIDTTVALTPLEGLKLFQENRYDLLILDLSLPQMDGLEVCRLIREESNIPIIISSARFDMRDKTLGFAYGADDYLSKPYNPDELLFRIEAIMRRIHPESAKKRKLFERDESAREITKESSVLKLSPAEYEILSYMMQKERSAISREEMLLNIGAIHYESSLKSIDVMMGRIRQKIGDDAKNPRYIVAVRGIGYKFVNE
ncbi:MAG: response regulator transcription factor [Sulfurimonas sp.]|nr:response regulator transcription factor [Sulfurimonas sp.]